MVTNVGSQGSMIRAGRVLVRHDERQALVLFESLESSVLINWPKGKEGAVYDKEIEAKLIRSDEDFFEFALILAKTHGLLIKRLERRPCGPACVFV